MIKPQDGNKSSIQLKLKRAAQKLPCFAQA